jgi:hypothetical protein
MSVNLYQTTWRCTPKESFYFGHFGSVGWRLPAGVTVVSWGEFAWAVVLGTIPCIGFIFHGLIADIVSFLTTCLALYSTSFYVVLIQMLLCGHMSYCFNYCCGRADTIFLIIAPFYLSKLSSFAIQVYCTSNSPSS